MEKITSYMRVTKRKAQEAATKPAGKALLVEKPSGHASLAPPTLKKPKKEQSQVVVDADGEIYDHGVHVPQFIYHTVGYERKGDSHKVPTTTQTLVDYVEKHYNIPVDLETSHGFGPHSGLSYESRLLRAYKFKQLQSKTKTAPPAICLTCTQVGHTDRECPDGF